MDVENKFNQTFSPSSVMNEEYKAAQKQINLHRARVIIAIQLLFSHSYTPNTLKGKNYHGRDNCKKA